MGGSGAAGVCSGLVGFGCVGELVAPSQRVSRFRRREERTYNLYPEPDSHPFIPRVRRGRISQVYIWTFVSLVIVPLTMSRRLVLTSTTHPQGVLVGVSQERVH